MKGVESWSQLARNRLRVSKKIGKIWDVPIVKKRMDRLLANITQDSRVLEVGAGDRRYGADLNERFPGLHYRSLDVDPDTRQDYYSLDDIQEQFDFVFLFEVIEHLELLDGLGLLEQLRSRIRSGGRILLSTPNLYHPHQYFGDSTHVTFYKFEELGGLMMTAGFRNIRAFRVYNDAYLRRMFRMYVGVRLHKYLGIDFARTMLLEGENA
jgi:SAM-dependent methyltransferase